MSIKIMSRIWEHSKQGGSQLLLLLAIGDNANDAGFAWPGQKYLAKKIRMSERSIPRLAAKLQETGELFFNSRGDAGQVTQYIVITDMNLEDFKGALAYLKYNKVQTAKAIKWFADILEKAKKGGVTDCQGCQDVGGDIAMSGGVDIAMSGGVDIAMSTEPSITINEPSILPNSQKTEKSKTKPFGHGLNADEDERKNRLNGLAERIATITKTDIEITGVKTREALKALTLALSKKPNLDAKLTAYEKWWYVNDWRGKQGQPPTVWTMGDTWGQFEADKIGPPNSATSNGPVLSDAEKTRLAELVAENAK